MTTARLLVNTSGPTVMGNFCAETVQSIIEAREKMARFKAAVDQMKVGDDYAAVAAELGCINAAAAEALAYLVAVAQPKLEDALIVEFCSKVDQGG